MNASCKIVGLHGRESKKPQLGKSNALVVGISRRPHHANHTPNSWTTSIGPNDMTLDRIGLGYSEQCKWGTTAQATLVLSPNSFWIYFCDLGCPTRPKVLLAQRMTHERNSSKLFGSSYFFNCCASTVFCGLLHSQTSGGMFIPTKRLRFSRMSNVCLCKPVIHGTAIQLVNRLGARLLV